jgi:hypothetical protein
MADLQELDRAEAVKIVGANPSTGVADNYAQVDSNGTIQTGIFSPSGTAITSASNGTAGSQLLHIQTPDTSTSTSTLGALDAAVTIVMAGLPSVGFQINSGSFIGTLIPESSLDGGTSWDLTYFIDSSTNSASNSFVFSTSNTLKILSVVPLNGASHVRVRVGSYTSGSATALLRASVSRGATQSISTTQVVSSLPAATFSHQQVITNGTTRYTVFTASQKLAIKQFYAGGTGIGKQVLYSYLPSNTQFLNSGDFETTGDVTNWPYFSNGGAGTGTVALSNAQAFTGTHSESVTFSTSDANHSNGIKQTFSPVLDISGWRYITAEFFNTLSSGGAYTRTISIVITDSNGSTRKFDVSGSSTASPFNASNWIKITGEIANPTSSTGTNFDVTSVVSIELRMVDSANKSGTVYWDTARLEAQITPVFPIYHQANVSFNIAIDPVFVMNVSDQILLAQTNNDTARQEYYALAGGVSIT